MMRQSTHVTLATSPVVLSLNSVCLMDHGQEMLPLVLVSYVHMANVYMIGFSAILDRHVYSIHKLIRCLVHTNTNTD